MATCLVGASRRSLLLVLQDRSGPKGHCVWQWSRWEREGQMICS